MDYGVIAMDSITGRSDHGPACSELEQQISAFIGTPFAICMARARTAIYFAVRQLLDVRPKRVILSPYTTSDVVNMVVCAGGTPVFADLEEGTCNISVERVAALLDDSIGAVLVTHLHGLACPIDDLVRICRARGVPVIEDAAQAFGTRIDGRSVGSFGDVGVLSFGTYKNLTTFFGGALVTSDAALQQAIRDQVEVLPAQNMGHFLREAMNGLATDMVTFPLLFRAVTFWLFRFALLHDIELLNSRVSFDVNPNLLSQFPEAYLVRMRPLQARLALAKLGSVDEHIDVRIEQARRYHEGLSDIPEIGLPPLRTDRSHTYSYFPIQVEDRERFVKHMVRSGRDVAVQHLKNCADMECFAGFQSDCPVARRTANEIVLLPTYPGYTQKEVERTIDVARSYFKRS